MNQKQNWKFDRGKNYCYEVLSTKKSDIQLIQRFQGFQNRQNVTIEKSKQQSYFRMSDFRMSDKLMEARSILVDIENVFKQQKNALYSTNLSS